ncbi:hypothetical protein GCM10023188_36340 [Pontibacter saemangeumensis]|uniref:non-specific serine/threonine protein kinase n=1 Tax=Pontibacter saemangeumensis TaxID=1084525 RepID=A0ABP8LZQ3_9BACT
MSTLQQNDVFAGHYLLKELIGRGGFSEVWKTEDLMADGIVEAIKVYAPESGMDEIGIKQFRNEYITIRSLDHPHLMQVYRFDIQNGVPYLVMPFMERGSLSRLLYEKGPFSEADIALVMKQVGGGLDYLHTRQPAVLHQDIKPDNILVTNDGSYKLADFGISSRTRNTLRKVTGHKQALALAYAPPERFAAHPINNQAGDMFSLGVTLYELCTGEVPWMGNGGLGLLQGAEIPDLPSTYSRILNNIIKACLNLDWEKRPTAKQLEQEGAYFLENDSWKPYGSFAPNITAKPLKNDEKPYLKPALYTVAIFLIIAAALLFPKFIDLNTGQVKQTVAKPVADSVQVVQTVSELSKGKEAPVSPTTVATAAKEPVAETPTPEVSPASSEAVKNKAPVKRKREVTREIPTRQPLSFSRPETLGDYLMAIKSQDKPATDRHQWYAEASGMFASGALVYDEVDGTVIKQYKAPEFLNMLLKGHNIKSIRITNREDDATGKVQKLYVQIVQK